MPAMSARPSATCGGILRSFVAAITAATVRAQLYSVEDSAGLLAFRDGGDPSIGDAASWSADSGPCDEGWYSREVGWRAVDCNAPG